MLSTSNILGRIINNGVLQIKNFSPTLSRTYHFISTISLNSTFNLSSSLFPSAITTNLSGIYSKFLIPNNPIISQVAGFKVKGRLRRRCKDCYFVMRQQRLYVICKTHPRHKQMAMKARDYKSWILTHATQSKIRPY